MCTRLFVKNCAYEAGKYAKNRVKEEVILHENKLEYKYKQRHLDDGTEKGKCVIMIPYRFVKIIHNTKANCFTFAGKIYCEYEDGAPEITEMLPCGNIKTFIIYDYFEPSLAATLKDKIINSPQKEDSNAEIKTNSK